MNRRRAFFNRKSVGLTDYDLTAQSGWLHCYSLAKRIVNYSGPCMRIRRDSDLTETNIGFNGQIFDKAAISSFCAGTIGRVRILYDQFSGVNMIGIGELPTIYKNGEVEYDIRNNSNSGFEFPFNVNRDFSMLINGRGGNQNALVCRGFGNRGLSMSGSTNKVQFTYYARFVQLSPIDKQNIQFTTNKKLIGYNHVLNSKWESSAYVENVDNNQLTYLGSTDITTTLIVPTTNLTRVFATVGTDADATISGYSSVSGLSDYFIFSENQIMNLEIFNKRFNI